MSTPQAEVQRLHEAAATAEAASNQQALAAHAELLRLAGMLDSHLQTLDVQQLQQEQVRHLHVFARGVLFHSVV